MSMSSSEWYARHMAFDFEASGKQPEYALQPWRIKQGAMWATSLAWVRRYPTWTAVSGGLFPDRAMMKRMLEEAIKEKIRLVGWNVVYDIAILLAYDLEELVFECKWLDGMLIWKHATVEPQYDETQRPRSYSLKVFVPEHFPEHAGYEADIDYHGDDPVELERLHNYNIKDNVFTLRGTKMYWDKLTDQQRRVAIIEAECFPMIAKANLHGMIIDTPTLNHLDEVVAGEADAAITQLAPLGMTEQIAKSPAKLRHLMFDVWGMTPHHTTKKGEFSTDKETMHELAAAGDPRAKVLRKYREALNRRSKFIRNPLRAAAYNGDGRAHPEAKVFSTYTGRMTYSSNQKSKVTKKGKVEIVAGDDE
jgi:DNA polymerase I-like protein with 3'-5' exonuclease and polymerase domains